MEEVIEDQDSDGVADLCDYLVSSSVDEAGGVDVVLKRRFRNRDFNDAGTPFTTFVGVDTVKIQQQDVMVSAVTASELTIPIPAGLSPGPASVEGCPESTCTSPGIFRDPLFVRRLAFSSVSGSDYVRPFDEAS
ncbi:MAG: hypothetical protein ACE5IK_06410, partial [Acidobacteriota bacterium]